ncbi:endonuclease domain-containing protein [Microbacterium sp. bgisy203]|uniref:endonuclease domain-containing protein n=1 Tax=Microbacterium sp. bgisy203 TaxID=3413799 RepID=UPI003D746FF9
MPPSLADRILGVALHRDQLHAEGYTDRQLRALVRAGEVDVLRRSWFVSRAADDAVREAARLGGRLTCTSLARRRGWWMPEGIGDEPHLHFVPGSTGPRPRDTWPGVAHWTQPLVPLGRSLVAGVEDALAHIALCQSPDAALALWESASRVEKLSPEALRGVRWASRAARDLAGRVNGLADSGLEVLVCAPLRRLGVQVRQQVVLAGKPVDVLVGRWLVIQIDGWAHHSSSAQRSKDIAHDAELRLRGYTVLRFSYAQVVYHRDAVERTIRRALAAGLHTNSAV